MRSTEQLVELAKTGDNAAIRELVDRYERSAVATAWSIVGDFHLAQDVAQESLVAALRQLAQLRENRAFGPWLLTAVRRNANRSRTRRPAEVNGLALSEMAEDQPAWTAEFEDLVPMLRRLADHEQMVIGLRYLSGLSVRQIAEETGRPIGTVTKQLSRAIAKLQQMLVEVDS